MAVFWGSVWLIGFGDLWKVLAESCISHWMVAGSWQQQAKAPKVKRTFFLEIQQNEMSSRMGEVVDGRQKTKTASESIGRGICFRKGLGHRKVWRHLCGPRIYFHGIA